MTTLGRRLDWDSAFFGFPIAQAQATTSDDVVSIDAWAEQQGLRCLYLLVSLNDFRAIRAAEERGFFLTGIRTTCACVAPFDVSKSEGSEVGIIRAARSSDIPGLKKIAAESHTETRFYADPHFSRAACDRLYETWIERSCDGWADQVFVAERDRTLSGYISLHQPAPGQGTIGLFAVAQGARGAGFGRALIIAALRWLENERVSRVAVATQAQNIAAVRSYQRAGFTVSAVDVWLHKWW